MWRRDEWTGPTAWWTPAASAERLPLEATNRNSIPWQSETRCLPGCGCPQLPKPLAGGSRAHHAMKGPPCLYLPSLSQPSPLPGCCTVAVCPEQTEPQCPAGSLHLEGVPLDAHTIQAGQGWVTHWPHGGQGRRGYSSHSGFQRPWRAGLCHRNCPRNSLGWGHLQEIQLWRAGLTRSHMDWWKDTVQTLGPHPVGLHFLVG